MKMSTAMALGSTMMHPIAGVFYTGHAGCALGMVSQAAPSDWNRLYEMSRKLKVSRPCLCKDDCFVYGSGMMQVRAGEIGHLGHCIVHLFNHHVMTRKDWTMEQLIDWVASVEPPDPEEAEVRKEIHEEVLACR
jgi:hypothetical protein